MSNYIIKLKTGEELVISAHGMRNVSINGYAAIQLFDEKQAWLAEFQRDSILAIWLQAARQL